MNKKTVLTYGVIVLLLVVSFVAGMQTGKSKKTVNNRNIPNGMNQNFTRGTGMNTRSGASNIMGEVLSKDENSLTIKSKTNGSKIIIVSKSTEIFKTIAGSIADIAIGTNVMITGKEGDAGSTVADSIRIVDNISNTPKANN